MAELRSVGSPFGRRATDARSGWPQTRSVLRAVVVIAAVIGALWLIYALRSVILLLVLSIFFAYLLAPLVSLVRRPFRLRGVERQLSPVAAIALAYVGLFLLLTVALAWLIPRFSEQVTQIAAQAPAYVQTVQAGGQHMTDAFNRLGLPPDARAAMDRTLATLVAGVEETVRGSLAAVVGLFAYLPWLVLIPILGFFFLKDGESLLRNALWLLPPGRTRAAGAQLFDRVNVALAAYIRAQLIACVLVGVVVGVGFALLAVPYSLILGVVAGLAEFIPLVGPIVVAIVSAIIAGIRAPILAFWVLIFLGVLRVAEDYVVYPRLVGAEVHLHPLTIIIAVLAGAQLGGVPGVFLAVPAVTVLSAAYRQFAVLPRGQPGGSEKMANGETRTA